MILYRLDATQNAGEFTRYYRAEGLARAAAEEFRAGGWLVDFYRVDLAGIEPRIADRLCSAIWPTVRDEQIVARIRQRLAASDARPPIARTKAEAREQLERVLSARRPAPHEYAG